MLQTLPPTQNSSLLTIPGAPIISETEFGETRNRKLLHEYVALANNVKILGWSKDKDGVRTLRFIGTISLAMAIASHGYTVRVVERRSLVEGSISCSTYEIRCTRVGCRFIPDDELDSNDQRIEWVRSHLFPLMP